MVWVIVWADSTSAHFQRPLLACAFAKQEWQEDKNTFSIHMYICALAGNARKKQDL
jgi:hypothetical protein